MLRPGLVAEVLTGVGPQEGQEEILRQVGRRPGLVVRVEAARVGTRVALRPGTLGAWSEEVAEEMRARTAEAALQAGMPGGRVVRAGSEGAPVAVAVR